MLTWKARQPSVVSQLRNFLPDGIRQMSGVVGTHFGNLEAGKECDARESPAATVATSDVIALRDAVRVGHQIRQLHLEGFPRHGSPFPRMAEFDIAVVQLFIGNVDILLLLLGDAVRDELIRAARFEDKAFDTLLLLGGQHEIARILQFSEQLRRALNPPRENTGSLLLQENSVEIRNGGRTVRLDE